ncbi:MAG: alpha/beta hydrolase [Firmicutes bacterium]|nr:alpha/beta hydrolase [Bacillota bacterium]
MISLKARLVLFMLYSRNRRIKQKENVDWSTREAVVQFRQRVGEGAGRFGALPDGIETRLLTIGDIPAEWILHPRSTSDRVMLYVHGGGYVSGTIDAHRAIVAKFVHRSEVGALLFEYRLAPENPYPAALEDSLAVYRWLLGQGVPPSSIVLVGDSAGGGLALATMLALKDLGEPLPAAAAVYSPVTDYTCSGESYRTNAGTCLSPTGIGPAFARHYAGGEDPGIPYISPLHGDLHGLPPLLIYAGGYETLLDDSLRFAEKARAAGVEVRLEVGERMFHCYPACAPMFPEATAALNDICDFVRAHLP